jgi:hypothetical protein
VNGFRVGIKHPQTKPLSYEPEGVYTTRAEAKTAMDAEIARDPEFRKHYEVLPTYGYIGSYKSSHFPDVDNYLAHARVSDRAGPNGEKILHVEEIQSDLHQEGRKKGYKTQEIQAQLDAVKAEHQKLGSERIDALEKAKALPDYSPEYQALIDRANDIVPLRMKLTEQGQSLQSVLREGVPDAPFKKNWHELTMKRIMDDAVKGGYDKVVITPGAEQAKRYDLSKQVDQITARRLDDKYDLHITGKNGDVIYNGKYQPRITAEEMENIVGKEMTQKIVNNAAAESENRATHIFNGVDLQVGGEGMKGFYDEMLPSYLNKYGEKYGAKVGQYDLQIPPQIASEVSGYTLGEEFIRGEATWPEFLAANPRAAEEFSAKFHSFDITPQMRDEITTKGQSLYQAAPPVAIGAGLSQEEPAPEPAPTYRRGGAVSQDAMNMAVWDHPIKRVEGGDAEPTIEEMRASLIPSTMNPNIAAQGKKGRANMAPPTSVMDPRSRDYERRSRETENFLIGADILAGALPFAPLAKGAAMAARRYAGPELARGLENYMVKSGAVLPMDVWHGSPHRFPPTAKNPLGEFDASKIGTGEGAQAYGAGLYLAEAPGVAKGYASKLATFDEKLFGPIMEKHNISGDIAPNMNNVDFAKSLLADYGNKLNAAEKKVLQDSVKSYLYKVDLPDEQIAKMLDWDKPLSQQHPDVQAAFGKLMPKGEVNPHGLDMGGGGKILDNRMGQADPKQVQPWVLSSGGSKFGLSQKDVDRMVADYGANTTGENAYTRLTASLNGQDKATAALRQAGIPGIRYLDGSSRTSGAGTSNFVVFDPAHMNIIGRE